MMEKQEQLDCCLQAEEGWQGNDAVWRSPAREKKELGFVHMVHKYSGEEQAVVMQG